jgi:hypothetical protein
VTTGGSGWASENDERQFRRLHDVSYQLQSIDRTPDDRTVHNHTIVKEILERVEDVRVVSGKDPE